MFRPAKLLITIVDKGNGDHVIAACKRGGAKGGTRAAGRGMAEYFADGAAAQGTATESLLFTLLYDEAESVVQEVRRASLEELEPFRGIALVLDAALISTGSGMKNGQGAPERAKGERMNSGAILITCIITHGQADEIMSVARLAGARGGTILNARGTGTEDDVTYFGISLASEKEMLLIVAQREQARDILEAVRGLTVFSEPGGGIVYATPVEDFFVLGHNP
jgi:nitrogen regulatory protein PII